MAEDLHISIFTLTLGRTYYLDKLLASVIEAARSFSGRIEHHVCFQGVEPEATTMSLAAAHGVEGLHIEIHRWPENLGIAMGMNRIIPELRGAILIKMDDDCLIQSSRFFQHVCAVSTLMPRAFFAPFPAGLLGDVVGGVPKIRRRSVVYSAETDTYYTLRPVDHLGGFCRISPASLVRGWVLDADIFEGGSGSEDTQYSDRCRRGGIEMYYLENALIVEHQETALGQRARYQGYFSDRFPEEFKARPGWFAWSSVRRSAGRVLRRLKLIR